MNGLQIYTLSHVIISLVAIAAGLLVTADFLRGQLSPRGRRTFVYSAALTDLGGFAFPFTKVLPSPVIAVLALVILAFAVAAKHRFSLRGIWKWIYVDGLLANQFFLIFVLIAQGFGKISYLHDLAPTQSEPPFAIAQGLLLIVFLAVGYQCHTQLKNSES